MTSTHQPSPGEPFLPVIIPIQDHGGATQIHVKRAAVCYYLLDAVTNHCVYSWRDAATVPADFVQTIIAAEYGCDMSAVLIDGEDVSVDGRVVAYLMT